MSWPAVPPPKLPPGWHAVPCADPATGGPALLLRMKPYWRRVAIGAAVGGVLLLWAFTIFAYTRGGGGPILCFLVFASVSGAAGTAVMAATQDGWLVTPTGLAGGRVWVSTGTFRRPPRPAVALRLRDDETDDVPTVHLDAVVPPGHHSEIFHETDTGTRAEPLAAWLSAVTGLPVAPREHRRRRR
ncbi:hypothetical protein Daura_16540 [Dactylosporangium aurantiacum]|uniref:Uncharacterized protein n=1 Tax=Dactylosporangium aurantiacum TaxID=35754 RepID=A0A9Q9MM27_9ACTN|nr:hypothetical protein [Dactylosporangium aurantiacum]MDG6103115.1 hypothetical protein [Dactylosporangium aurantiacum]UWZ57626.1 hypothetical protein Daura_16540 [Dactylosporangium aurantiacum]